MIVVAVVNCGVTPVVTAIFGVTVPEYSRVPEPVELSPIPKFVIVFEPPVQAGKLIVATGEALFEVMVQPELDRATATRA